MRLCHNQQPTDQFKIFTIQKGFWFSPYKKVSGFRWNDEKLSKHSMHVLSTGTVLNSWIVSILIIMITQIFFLILIFLFFFLISSVVMYVFSSLSDVIYRRIKGTRYTRTHKSLWSLFLLLVSSIFLFTIGRSQIEIIPTIYLPVKNVLFWCVFIQFIHKSWEYLLERERKTKKTTNSSNFGISFKMNRDYSVWNMMTCHWDTDRFDVCCCVFFSYYFHFLFQMSRWYSFSNYVRTRKEWNIV